MTVCVIMSSCVRVSAHKCVWGTCTPGWAEGRGAHTTPAEATEACSGTCLCSCAGRDGWRWWCTLSREESRASKLLGFGTPALASRAEGRGSMAAAPRALRREECAAQPRLLVTRCHLLLPRRRQAQTMARARRGGPGRPRPTPKPRLC